MSFDWANYLSLAEELAKTSTEMPNKEAATRAAISRAYYAAFKKAEEFVIRKDGFVVQVPQHKLPKHLQDEDGREQNLGSSHGRVIRQFTKDNRNQNRMRVGLALRRIKHNRESADYDAVYEGNIDEALSDTLTKARDIINRLKYLV